MRYVLCAFTMFDIEVTDRLHHLTSIFTQSIRGERGGLVIEYKNLEGEVLGLDTYLHCVVIFDKTLLSSL